MSRGVARHCSNRSTRPSLVCLAGPNSIPTRDSAFGSKALECCIGKTMCAREPSGTFTGIENVSPVFEDGTGDRDRILEGRDGSNSPCPKLFAVHDCRIELDLAGLVE